MKNFKALIFTIFSTLLLAGGIVYAATPGGLTVPQGGTGNTAYTAGKLLYGGTSLRLAEVATGTITCSGCSVSAGSYVVGNNLTITVTGGGSGSVATSSQETATYVPFWTSTNGTPALLSGGSSNFTWDNSGNILTSLHYLATGSSTLQNFTGLNSTTTNATTTTIFSTTASSTNLFTQLGRVGILTLGDPLSVANGGTGAKTLTGCLTGNGTGAITGSGTCNTSAASVTSVGSTNGISGGTITTSGTLSLISYLATSSLETSGRIPAWSSTSGNPATLSGGFAGYTLTSLLATLTNASTTALTVGSYFQPPNQSTSPTNTAAGSVVVNTNGTASSSIALGDGTVTNNIFAVHSMGMTLASSTLSYNGAYGASGSTTILIANPLHSSTLRTFYCKTNQGTAWVGFGTGSATTTLEANCSTTGVLVTPSANNTWTGRQNVYVEVGRITGTPDNITITADIEDSN